MKFFLFPLIISFLLISCIDPSEESLSLVSVENPSKYINKNIWDTVNVDSLNEIFIKKPFTIAVFYRLDTNDLGRIIEVGSGFAVDANTVFTNAHVAAACIKIYNDIPDRLYNHKVLEKSYCIIMDSGNALIRLNDFTLFDAAFLNSDESSDALLGYTIPDLAWANTKYKKIDSSYIFKIAKTEEINNIILNQPLFFVGYPKADYYNPVFGKSHFMEYENNPQALKENMILSIYDEKIYFGCSGSPLLSLKGEVVAVVFAHNEIFKYNYCVRADIINSLLNR